MYSDFVPIRIGFGWWLACIALAQFPALAQQGELSGVLLEVSGKPAPVKADHKLHLLYELHLTNFRDSNLELTRIDVVADQRSKAPLVSYDAQQLEKYVRRTSLANNSPNKLLMGSGQRLTVFMNVVITAARPPAALQHQLLFKDEQRREVREAGGRVEVSRASPVTINAPLRGAGWL